MVHAVCRRRPSRSRWNGAVACCSSTSSGRCPSPRADADKRIAPSPRCGGARPDPGAGPPPAAARPLGRPFFDDADADHRDRRPLVGSRTARSAIAARSAPVPTFEEFLESVSSALQAVSATPAPVPSDAAAARARGDDRARAPGEHGTGPTITSVDRREQGPAVGPTPVAVGLRGLVLGVRDALVGGHHPMAAPPRSSGHRPSSGRRSLLEFAPSATFWPAAQRPAGRKRPRGFADPLGRCDLQLRLVLGLAAGFRDKASLSWVTLSISSASALKQGEYDELEGPT